MWQPVVLCNFCRHRHLCRRRVSEPCTLAIICHGCEASLMVEITPGELIIQRSADSVESGAPFFITGLPITHPASPTHGPDSSSAAPRGAGS